MTVFPSYSFSARTLNVSSNTPVGMNKNMAAHFSPSLNIPGASLPKAYASKLFQMRNKVGLLMNILLPFFNEVNYLWFLEPKVS